MQTPIFAAVAQQMQHQQGDRQGIGCFLDFFILNTRQSQSSPPQRLGLVAGIEHQVGPGGTGGAGDIASGRLQQTKGPMLGQNLILPVEREGRDGESSGRPLNLGYQTVQGLLNAVEQKFAGFVDELRRVSHRVERGGNVVKRL